MVFPSLMFNVEPGLVSQFSALAIIGFSFMINKVKKIMMGLLVFFCALLFFNSSAVAFMAYPSQTYSNHGPYQVHTQNNLNYYGRPWGYAPPVYFYPQLQYHSLWGPQQPYYFRPHPTSPYAPPSIDCPYCQPQQPAPQFPIPVMHPGGAVS